MLFYRARLDGPAEVLDVSLSPVRPVRQDWGGRPGADLSRAAAEDGPGQEARGRHAAGSGQVAGARHGAGPASVPSAVHVVGTGLVGRARVVLRYGPAAGPVRTHRGWLHTDLAPGRRLRLAGCQVDGGEVLLSLAPVPAGVGREHLRDRFRLPFRLTSWGVEAGTGVRAELICIPTVRPGLLVLRGRAVVVLETQAARLVRAVPFCRLVAVELNAHLDWRARTTVEGVEVRVGPGGVVEGWLDVAVACRGEPGATHAVSWAGTAGREATGPGPAGTGAAGRGAAGWGAAGPGAAGAGAADRFAHPVPAAVRRVDAVVKRLEATVVVDGLALVSGAVELDVAWADRSGRGRWTCREVPFSALLSIAGLCEGDRLEPVAQVERLARAGKGADERAVLLLGVGVTALRAVHLDLGGSWYRVERVVGQAAATVEVSEPLFSREKSSTTPAAGPSRLLALETGLHAPWTALRAHIRRAGSRAALEVSVEPYGAGFAPADEGAEGNGDGLATSPERVQPCGDRSAPATARLDLPVDAGAVLSLAAVGPQAVVRAGRLPQDGGLEVALPRGTAWSTWHPLPEPVRWVVDAAPHPGGVACLVRCEGRLRRVVLPGDDVRPAALTVAGTAIPGAGMDRLWVEVASG